MVDEKVSNKNNLSANDTFDINELAALNEDISAELIENLQAKLAGSITTDSNANIFEEKEPEADSENTQKQSNPVEINSNIDDNFVKKYKAKLQKSYEQQENEKNVDNIDKTESPDENNVTENQVTTEEPPTQDNISVLSNGNIVEKEVTTEYLNYSNDLDLTDDNVNYSKYVVYISPENIDFIESLTVKERKNLINNILKEQGNIALSKKRTQNFTTIIIHLLIAVLVIALVIPITYSIINTSIETTIDNYRHSQSLFQTLYRENGKIKMNKNKH